MAQPSRKRANPLPALTEVAWKRYAAALDRYLARRLRRPEDIPDLTQEIFARFLQKAERPEVIRNPLAYLYGIAAHAVADACVQQQKGWVDFNSELAEEAQDATFDPAQPDELSEQLAMQRDIEQALALLPRNHLLALVLTKGDGLSVAEAARELGLTEFTVRNYCSDARYQLKKILEEYAKGRKRDEP